MKRSLLFSAIALAVASANIQAQEAPAYENWVGGFAQYYSPDSEKPEPLGYLDNGHTFGGELGFRFDPQWAVRFELSRIFLDMQGPNRPGNGDDGTMLGADAMYFLEDDVAYLFGGLREQSIEDSYRMLSYGVGKHWEASENVRVITELAGYRDFGQAYNEYSVKLGLAYIFGQADSTPVRKDSDNDGVYDAVDRCPTTPAGVQVDATGCNVDTDGDGVLNTADQCPNTPAGTTVTSNGCALKDADKDGVLDANDSCPNTPAGTEVNAKGCAVDLDKDGDGVLDSKDKCLDTPMTDKVDADGCSVLVEKEVSIALDVLFANNSSQIENPESAKILEFVEFMQRYGNTNAVVEGHTSSVGRAEYNQFLSQKRADSVRQMLITKYGIAAERLTAVGYGETQLKDPANTAEAHRVNRRIEVKVSAKVKTKATR
ncbi:MULTISPECIES: OmpA family protein [Alteromonadaceae]|uniref:OmpA family protein n=1 Tax=Brumicola blandensis TaxID=3075611 RepID=A0AAW8R2E5_9ALTE|nr:MULTISPECIES: OmpA family protein [unclassified Alteromonas]MDT0583501.1 OmpA family protein [Alteromonas sp. W409]MDT0629436.1 OmpA family protein [Alteromonas sp. W364]